MKRLTNFRRPTRRESQLKPELYSITALNCYAGHTSASRLVMDGAHWSQRVTVTRPEKRAYVSSTLEIPFGMSIDDIRAPEDCIIKASTYKLADPDINPETILMIEFEKNGETWLDFIVLPKVKSKHTRHGYELIPTEVVTEAGLNSEVLPEGTVLARTRSYDTEDGEYMFGVNFNVIAMSDVAVSEDGVVFSESAIKKLAFTNVQTTVIDLSSSMIPLNMWGDLNYFKMFPEIGEVTETGILFASKTRNDSFIIPDLNNDDICDVDHMVANPVRVSAGAQVVDIKVIKGRSSKPAFCDKMTEQLDKYADIELEYAKRVVEMFNRYKRNIEKQVGHPVDINITGNMSMILKEKEEIIELCAPKTRRKVSVRSKEIDQYRIEITTLQEEPFNLGKKTADMTGSKGTAVEIRPDHEMPCLTSRPDVRADIIMDGPTARTNRMNYSGTYGGYLGAVSQDNQYRLKKQLKHKYDSNYRANMTDEIVDYIFDMYVDIVSYINPQQEEMMLEMDDDERWDMSCMVLDHGFRFIQRLDNEFEITEIIECLEATPYAPFYDTITYTNIYGEEVTTEERTIMANDYFIQLDRTARDFSAVFAAKLNVFNVASKGSETDRRKYSHSKTPIASNGETKQRIEISNAPPELSAEVNDLAVNPDSLRAVLKNIFEGDKLFDEDFDIDRNIIPYGQSRPLNITKHVYLASGIEMSYKENNYGDQDD